MSYPPRLALIGQLTQGTTEHHLVKLAGAALSQDEPRPVMTVSGVKPGPVLFVNAGVHGAEYPAIEAVIRLGRTLEPRTISGTVILMPVLNLPAFRGRTPFFCPVDNVNPNRVFPGDPHGTYSEQLTYTLINDFVMDADAYIDLHGGDIPEDLVPFSICSGGSTAVHAKSKELALAFGLPYVLTVTKPVQAAKGLSSYAAATEKGVPAILAEAGGVGLMQESAVQLLVNGVHRVMAHLSMIVEECIQPSSPTPQPVVLTAFEWLYSRNAGMWYPTVAAGDLVKNGQTVGTIGDLFGNRRETVLAPVSGHVLFLTVNPSVQETGLLMGIGVA